MDTILVVNAGSSSVKFQVFAVDADGRLQRQLKGQMDGIGSRPRLRATGANGNALADRAYPIEAVGDVSAALRIAGSWLRDELRIAPMAVGHRVVHGGPDYDRPVLVDHGIEHSAQPAHAVEFKNRRSTALNGDNNGNWGEITAFVELNLLGYLVVLDDKIVGTQSVDEIAL